MRKILVTLAGLALLVLGTACAKALRYHLDSLAPSAPSVP